MANGQTQKKKSLVDSALADMREIKEAQRAEIITQLGEAFMPRINSLLSAKLAEELDDEGEEEFEDDVTSVDTDDMDSDAPDDFEDMSFDDESEGGEEFADEPIDDEFADDDSLDEEFEIEDEEDSFELEDDAPLEDEFDFEDDEELEESLDAPISQWNFRESKTKAKSKPVAKVDREKAALQKENRELKAAVKELSSTLNYLNRIQTQVKFVKEIFAIRPLTKNTKKKVVAMLSGTKSISEATQVKQSITAQLTVPTRKKVSETRTRRSASASKPTGAKRKPIQESASDTRLRRLAGLTDEESDFSIY